MHINQYLASKQYATRRAAAELVKQKRVFINGRVALIYDRVGPTDKVEVRLPGRAPRYRYWAYHKPPGVVTASPASGPLGPTAQREPALFPLGRLDKNSEGLLLLTDDGRLTDRLLNPAHAHEKEYEVTVLNRLRSNFKTLMEAGVDIGGYRTKPCQVTVLNRTMFRIILTEGKKHQIRRMCSALRCEVSQLKRVRILNIQLAKLPAGATRALKGLELKKFLELVGLGPH